MEARPVHLILRQAVIARRKCHILPDRCHKELCVRVLEDISDLFPDLGKRLFLYRDFLNPYAAGPGQLEPDQKLQKGGLSGAICPDQSHGILFMEGDGQILQNRDSFLISERKACDIDVNMAHGGTS